MSLPAVIKPSPRAHAVFLVLTSLYLIWAVIFCIPAHAGEAAVAQAAVEGAAQSAIQVFLISQFFPFLEVVVSGAFTAFVLWLANWAKQKFGLQLTQAQLDHVDGLVEKGIAMAEEKGAAYIQANPTLASTGSTKLNMAVDFVATQIKAAG
jgi:hypothetical protein